MKNRLNRHARTGTLLTAGSLLLLLGACGDSTEAKELRESSSQAWEDLKQYAISQRDALSVKMEEQLQDLDARLEDLEEDLDEAGEELRAKVDELRQSAATKLEELRTASSENWEKAKLELLSTVEELEKATRRLTDP